MTLFFTRQQLMTLTGQTRRQFEGFVTNQLSIKAVAKSSNNYLFDLPQALDVMLAFHLRRQKLPLECIKAIVGLVKENNYSFDRYYVFELNEYLSLAGIPTIAEEVEKIKHRLIPQGKTIAYWVLSQQEVDNLIARLVKEGLSFSVNQVKSPSVEQLLSEIKNKAPELGISPEKIPASV